MSDTFQSYVFNFGADDLAAQARDRVCERLIADGIIASEMANNVLGRDTGYLPGERSADFLVDDDSNWRGFAVNGVAMEVGRHVEASADVDTAICPNCRRAFSLGGAQFGEVMGGIGPWVDGEASFVRCENCTVAASVDLWDFAGRLALGDFSVCFWNWPEHWPDVADSLFEMTGSSPVKVEGRI